MQWCGPGPSQPFSLHSASQGPEDKHNDKSLNNIKTCINKPVFNKECPICCSKIPLNNPVASCCVSVKVWWINFLIVYRCTPQQTPPRPAAAGQ